VADDHRKLHPWGEDGRVDPDSLAPDDEERAAGPDGPTGEMAVRALSVAPFLLVAALGLIGIVSWVIILLLGAGSGDPIWTALRGLSAGALIWQLILAVLIGLVPLLITVGASWAAARGFRPDSGRTFWAVSQGLWGVAGIGLVYVIRVRGDLLTEYGFSATDWWFAFGVVAFAMILAGVRLRRAQRSQLR
jgi:hypothetical protein